MIIYPFPAHIWVEEEPPAVKKTARDDDRFFSMLLRSGALNHETSLEQEEDSK